MAKDKIIYISADDFTEKLIEISREYGQENFWGDEFTENGKDGIFRYYTVDGEDMAGFAAVKGEYLTYWLGNDKDTGYVVKYNEANSELFDALYNALEHGFSVDDDEENEEE